VANSGVTRGAALGGGARGQHLQVDGGEVEVLPGQLVGEGADADGAGAGGLEDERVVAGPALGVAVEGEVVPAAAAHHVEPVQQRQVGRALLVGALHRQGKRGGLAQRERARLDIHADVHGLDRACHHQHDHVEQRFHHQSFSTGTGFPIRMRTFSR
jgi:hypothetical protein